MAGKLARPAQKPSANLRSCWADGAAGYPQAAQWAKTAAPFILKLGPMHNGQSLSVGGFED